MDPTNGGSIATASLLSTWSAVSSVLPEKFQVPVSARLARQFDIGQGQLELKPSNLGSFLAWILELMLVAALVMGTNTADRKGPNAVGRLILGKLRVRFPFLGELSDAANQATGAATVHSRPYVDTQLIFPDTNLQSRVRPLLKHYRPYGPVDLLVVPSSDIAAMKAARELELLELIARKASALSRENLLTDPRFAATIEAMETFKRGPFAVFKITSSDLARHVLTKSED